MEWRTVKEAPFYMVSDEGHVKSLERKVKSFNGKVECYKHIPEVYPLKEKDIRGYKNVSIIQYDEQMRPVKRYTRQVHRLVLEAFNPVEGMDKLQVNHKDLDKGNNNIENLEWTTPQENTIHANKQGKGHQMNQNGEMNSMSRLTEEQVIKIIKMTKSKYHPSDNKIAKLFGVTRKTISHIRNNQTWTYIDRDSIS